MAKYDTSKPILILVRRGRKNRGFSVAPVEDISNAAVCADEKEVGEVIIEMLNDEEQPRVDINDLLAAAAGDSSDNESDEDDSEEDDDEDDDDDDEGDPAEGTIFEGVSSADDPADRILFNIFTHVVKKGQNMSSGRVRRSGKKRKKKKKT